MDGWTKDWYWCSCVIFATQLEENITAPGPKKSFIELLNKSERTVYINSRTGTRVSPIFQQSFNIAISWNARPPGPLSRLIFTRNILIQDFYNARTKLDKFSVCTTDKQTERRSCYNKPSAVGWCVGFAQDAFQSPDNTALRPQTQTRTILLPHQLLVSVMCSHAVIQLYVSSSQRRKIRSSHRSFACYLPVPHSACSLSPASPARCLALSLLPPSVCLSLKHANVLLVA